MERAATLRVITASGTAQQFFLRVSRDGDGTLTLTLCDGCTTWGGTVRDSGITPPKLGMTHTDFAERLLDGLQGAPGTEADAFSVTALHDDGRLLGWSAERQGKLGTKSVIKQEVSLALERPARPGAGLMELLLHQAHESCALQEQCREEAARAQRIEEEGAQLGQVAAQLEGARERMRTELRRRCLALLNRTKVRIRVRARARARVRG